MFKNVASQKWIVFAFDETDNTAVTGDAAQITGNLRIDGAAANAIDDTNPTELEDGYYIFDITQAETNGDYILIAPASSTGDVQVIGCPAAVFTRPPYFNALGIASDGDLTKVNTLDGHTAQTADNDTKLTAIEIDTGTTLPTSLATHDADIKAEFNSFAVGSAAVSKVADSATVTLGTETDTYAKTTALDSDYHIVTSDGNDDIDFYYQFDVGGNGIPVEIVWNGYFRGNNKTIAVEAWNWTGTPAWEQIGSITGTSGTTDQSHVFVTTTGHVGLTTNDGLVRIRFYSVDCTDLAIDRILCSYAVVAESVGYADGAIWVDSAGTAGAKVYTNGTADNPCPWANALTLNASLGLNRFHIANGNTVTLGAAAAAYSLLGANWNLALGGQSIEGLYVEGPNCLVTGIGTATVTPPSFKNCKFGTVTLPPCGMLDCGFAGHVTGGSAGQYAIKGGFSLVAGTGSPEFTFTGLGSATGVNARGWTGGAKYNLDSDCTVSHEVLAGGGTHMVSNAATIEIRGTTRSLDLDLTGAGQIQFVGITGLIDISGATSAAVNLYGVSSSITNTSNTPGVTLTDATQTSVDQNAILADTNELQTDWTNAGRLDAILDLVLEDTANLQGNQGNWATATSVDLNADAIKAVSYDESTAFPIRSDDTGATEIARTGADSDTLEDISDEIAGLNNISAAEVNAEVDSALDTALPGSPTAGSVNDYVKRAKFALCNKWTIDETNGNLEVFNDVGGSFTTVAAAFTTLANVTTRKKIL